MKFYLRLTVLTFLRFLALLAIGIFVRRFEVSPLPEWTLYAFGYATQFALTFFFTVRALRSMIADRNQIGMVALFFLIGGTMLEGILYLLLAKASLRELAANYTLSSLWLAGWYLLAVVVGGWQARRRG